MEQHMPLQDLVTFAGAQTMLILVGLVASGKVHVISIIIVTAAALVWNHDADPGVCCSLHSLRRSNATFHNFEDAIKMSLGRGSVSRAQLTARSGKACPRASTGLILTPRELVSITSASLGM